MLLYRNLFGFFHFLELNVGSGGVFFWQANERRVLMGVEGVISLLVAYECVVFF
jgi:hypothetical protein